MAADLVRATNLTRRFGLRVAVENVSLTLRAGEILALLGPNGAGKTTTLRMITGLISPSEGEIQLQGVPLTPASSDRLRQHVGLLTESPGLWDRLSVSLNLLTYARLYGSSRPHATVERTLQMVGLADRARDLAGTLSKGLRQRLAIARALVHEPSIVLLDEPTSGLDPASARHIRDLILDLGRQGRAVIVSTHNLAEAEALADHIAVINTRLLANDTPGALRRLLKGSRLEVELEGDAARWLTVLAPRDRGHSTAAGSLLTVVLDDVTRTPDLVSHLAREGARIRRVTPSERSLEDVYLTLVGDMDGAA